MADPVNVAKMAGTPADPGPWWNKRGPVLMVKCPSCSHVTGGSHLDVDDGGVMKFTFKCNGKNCSWEGDLTLLNYA